MMKRVLRFSTSRGTRVTQCNSSLTLAARRGAAGDDGEDAEGRAGAVQARTAPANYEDTDSECVGE